MRTVVISLHPALDRIVRVSELIPGDTFDGHVELLVPSGKGTNTARGIYALSEKRGMVLPLVWLGVAERAWYARELHRISGLRAVVGPRNCATRQALTLLEKDGRETHIKEAMAPVTRAEERAFLRLLAKTVRRGDTVVLAGSPPPGVSDAFVRKLFLLSRQRGASRVVSDTHGRLLAIAATAGLDGVKGNAKEIGEWLRLRVPFDPQNSTHRERLGAALSKKGSPKAVMITRGSAGACYADAAGVWAVRAPKLRRDQFKSATGCGDAATAGWMQALTEGLSPGETLRFAVSCGSAKACSADPGHLDPALARSLHKTVAKAVFYPKKGLLSV